MIDLNLLHYRELSIVGSEWIGTPPNQRRERYAESVGLLQSGDLALERLIDRRRPLGEAGDVLSRLGRDGAVKTVLEMGGS
jgi:threonine dehydrogenase-like Zn-dependent dehydrogenase